MSLSIFVGGVLSILLTLPDPISQLIYNFYIITTINNHNELNVKTTNNFPAMQVYPMHSSSLYRLYDQLYKC